MEKTKDTFDAELDQDLASAFFQPMENTKPYLKMSFFGDAGTGKTFTAVNVCYRLIKNLKSPIAAFIWQRVAKIWGYNLKAPYYSEEHEDIELILLAIESEGL